MTTDRIEAVLAAHGQPYRVRDMGAGVYAVAGRVVDSPQLREHLAQALGCARVLVSEWAGVCVLVELEH